MSLNPKPIYKVKCYSMRSVRIMGKTLREGAWVRRSGSLSFPKLNGRVAMKANYIVVFHSDQTYSIHEQLRYKLLRPNLVGWSYYSSDVQEYTPRKFADAADLLLLGAN